MSAWESTDEEADLVLELFGSPEHEDALLSAIDEMVSRVPEAEECCGEEEEGDQDDVPILNSDE